MLIIEGLYRNSLISYCYCQAVAFLRLGLKLQQASKEAAESAKAQDERTFRQTRLILIAGLVTFNAIFLVYLISIFALRT
jgi:hypothetical protein